MAALPAAATPPAAPGRPGTLLAAALHLALVLPLAALASVDVDEAYSLATSGLPLADTLHRALTFELQPPLYFLLLNLWRVVDDGVLWARLFSVACTTSVVLLAPWIARRWLPGLRPPWLALALAVSPQLVWAGFTVRGYALIVLLSTLLLGLARDAFFAGPGRSSARVVFSLVALIALHTQYYLGFLLAGLGAALLLERRWQALTAYAVAMTAVGLATLPLLSHTVAQVGAHTLPRSGGLAGSLEAVVRLAEALVLPVHRAPVDRWLRWIARLLLWGAAGLSLLAAWRAGRRPGGGLALPALVAVMGILFAAARTLTGDETVEIRHVSGLLVPALVLALAWLSDAPRAGRRVVVGVTVVLALSMTALWRDYHDGDRHPAHKAAAAHLERHPRRQPDQPIFVFPTDSVLSLAHHFPGPNPLVGLPADPSLTVYVPSAFVVADRPALEARLDAALAQGREAWLVRYTTGSFQGVDLGEPMLDAVLDDRFEVLDRALFEDCEVRLLGVRAERPGR